MASSFLTLAKPFLLSSHSQLPSPSPSLCVTPYSQQRLPFSRTSALRITAVAAKWEPSKVVPQADRVLIRLEELAEKSSGGVLLPKSAVKFERYLMGEVLSAGTEVSEVEAGKKVLFSDINAYEFCLMELPHTTVLNDDKCRPCRLEPASRVDLGTNAKHCFCRASDLLAVVE